MTMGEKKFNTWQLIVGVLLSIGAGFVTATTVISAEVSKNTAPIVVQVDRNTARIGSLEDRVIGHQATVIEMLHSIKEDITELKKKNNDYDDNIREFYKNPPWQKQ